MARVAAIVDVVRRADWLTEERARVYGRLVVLAMLVGAMGQFGQIGASALRDGAGRPMATDFNAFWSGARLAAAGRAADAYSETAIRREETVGAQPAGHQYLPYLYPPVFLLLSLPIGLLPYLPAMLAFGLCGYVPVCLCLRRLLPAPWPLGPILALPAGLMNATLGQSGFVSALALAGSALWLERRPMLAGACLGLLAYKPHLALAVPVALLAARRWRACCACIATALVLVGGSWAAFGTATWLAFLRAAPLTRDVLLSPLIWNKLLSVYAGARLLHAGPATALAIQAACGVLALAVLWRIAARRPGAAAESSAMVAAALLCTPYVLDYDLVGLAVPLAWLAAQGAASGWRAWEKGLLATLYLTPLFARTANVALGVPLAPLLLGGLLALVARRVLQSAPRRLALAAAASA